MKTHQKNIRNIACHRRGMASLEFVLGLPFLLGIMAIIYAVGTAGIAKMDVALQVREQVWRMREPDKKHSLAKFEHTPVTSPMKFTGGIGDTIEGEVAGQAMKSWQTYAWLGGTKTTGSTTSLVHGTWDHTQIDDFDRAGPHVGGILGRIGGVKGLETILGFLDRVIGFVL